MFDLSIICNLHQEGDLLLETIRNLRNILNYTRKRKSWDAIEVIAVLDNSDEKTKKNILENQELFDLIEHVDFRDLALSRNHGVNVARHRFVLFFDGDDFVSHKALVGLYNTFYSHYSKHPQYDIAVFPRQLVEFPTLYFQSYVDSNNFIKENMMFTHCFVSRISCLKSLLIDNPLRKNEGVYGYEDWDLNNRLLAQGIKFKVIKNYVLYYRRNNPLSLLQNQVKNKCILRNSLIYEIEQSTGINVAPNYKNLLNKLTVWLGRSFEKYQQNRMIKKSKKFLKSYGEFSLNLTQGRLFGSTREVSDKIIVESDVYRKMKAFFSGKEVVLMLGQAELNSLDLNEFSHACILCTDNVVSENDFSGISIFRLSALSNWDWIRYERKMEVVLKAIINTRTLKTIYCIDSDLGLNIIKYYSSVFEEYNKKIIIKSAERQSGAII